MDLKLHDIVEMKKEHPCGSRRREGCSLCRLPCIGADGPLLRVHDDPQTHPLRCAKGQCKQPEAKHGGTERRKILSFHPLSLPAMSV